MLYKPSMYQSVLGISSSGEVQIEFTLKIDIYTSQRVKITGIVLSGASPAFNIDIPIAIRGSVGLTEHQVTLTDTITIDTIADASTVALVKAAIGSDVYTLDAVSKIDATPVGHGGGTISQSSDIEIL